ncbi:MAG: DUF308 domain-containing protein [Coriobacteriales bacterium]|nr:DUF308 domain-containing protein [Coriobacteriales bacterium]
MSDKFARTKPAVLVTGLVMTILGIVILVHPIAAMELLIRIIGFVLVGFGLFNIISAFMKGDPVKNSPGNLALGILALLPGLFFAINPAGFITLAWTFVGIVILVTGLLDIMEAGEFRRMASPLAMPATASGVITALLGILVIFAPIASATVGMLAAAVALLIDGITEIIFGLGM